MSTHRILDSSPIPIPPTRPPYHAGKEVDEAAKSRSLKRSASVASLPTPPRTHHKRTRSRARSSASNHSSDESGSDLDEDLGGGYAARLRAAASKGSAIKVGQRGTGSLAVGSKRQRTSEVLAGQHDEEEDENVFWTGRSGTSIIKARGGSAAAAQDASKQTSQSRSPSPALLRYRVKAPVSPPPSRRQSQAPVQTQRAITPAVDEPPLPVTPPRRLFAQTAKPAVLSRKKSKSRDKIWPVRDSPNNPFLEIASSSGPAANEWDTSSDEESDVIGEALEREGTPTPAKVHEEKPTITYVFRGQKATFQNPLYDLPASVLAASRLPVDHPDFEAYDACPPKRLFMDKKRKSKDIDAPSEVDKGKRQISHQQGSKSRSTSAEREPVFSKPSPSELTQLKSASRPGSASLSRASSAERVDRGRERADVLIRARESREQREKENKARMESREGLRAGAVFTEKDEPARRAMGPVRPSSGA